MGSGDIMSGERFTISSSSATLSRRAAAVVWVRCTVSGSATRSDTVSRGFRDVYGSWKTICMSRPGRAGAEPRSVVRSRPATWILPESGFSRPTSIRASVVLPQPDSPTTPEGLAASHVRLTSSTALTGSGPGRPGR